MRHAILFPGQGAQDVGMGRELFEHYASARAVFEEADEVLGYSLSRLCFEGPADELVRTDRAQPAIFVTSMAAIRAFAEAGRFEPEAVAGAAGLSLGEYTACCFAGAFGFADGLRLVQRRGSAMQEACEAEPSGMITLLGADRARAEEVCDAARKDGVLVVANLNAPGQVVLSGDREACGRARAAASTVGVRRAIPLDVAGAFHSPLMDPARRALEDALAGTEIADPRIPVYSNVTAAPVTSAQDIRGLLARQVTSPVLWEDSMRRMIADALAPFVEPPPGAVLAGLMRKIAPEAAVNALGSEA